MANERILVVEDNAVIAENIKMALTDRGYSVSSLVSSGEKAIECAGVVRPDLILMDIRLAGEIDGVEAAHHIRASTDIPVIYLTAYADEELLARAKTTEPYGYLLKPFLDKELHATIQIALYKHRMNRQLSESENRYRAMMIQAADGILLLDAATLQILETNPAMEKLLGWSSDELSQLSLVDLIFRNKEQFDLDINRLQGEQVCRLGERIFCKKDGLTVHVDINAALISYNAHETYSIMVRDLTELKRAEEEHLRLQHWFSQVNKAESLNRMAGAIAHHFNNQLGVVSGYLELAMIDLPSGSEVQASLAEAMKASHRASEVSTLMLTYLGQTPGKREQLDLSEVCRWHLPMLRAAMPKNVALETDLPSLGPAITANANQIQQVLTNLITNAWEAFGDDRGAIYLTIKTVSLAEIPAANRFPFDWQPQDSAYACLEVRDTDFGIAEKEIEKVFDPFFSTKFTGRGLGLPVVLGIVRGHGGVVTVESEPGRGSVFRVFFPVSAEEVPRRQPKGAQAPEIEESGTVLLVEDEEMLRDMVATLLTRLGFTVLEAEDGVEAVEVFRQHQDEIRCVLCDLTMPRMNGWETLAALRALRPDVPVVLASGYDEARVMEGKHAELPQVFLHKPYRMSEVKAALDAAMGASSAEGMKRD